MLDHDEEETYMDDYRNTIDKEGFNICHAEKFWRLLKYFQESYQSSSI